MTDFGLTNGYQVHDGLDQREAATQYILDIASEFFQINDISINNNKMVAIPINSRVSNLFLSISGLSIFISKKGKSHRYLSIFFSTEGLSKSSLVKANLDIRFFTNLVLRKAVSDKQLLYLVSANTLIHKGLKLKFGLLLNFSSNTIYHPSFYGLKSFFQVQSESKVASLISFANSGNILGHLFSYRSHDLQVLCWHPVYLLSSPVYIHVSAFDNFLVGIVCILLDCNLSLGGSLVNPFWFCGEVPMSTKKLDSHGSVSEWFKLSVVFLNSRSFSLIYPSVLNSIGSLNILESFGTDSLSVYIDGSLSNLSTVGYRAGTGTFFEDINLGLGIGVSGLMSSTLAELQAIALALKSVPSLSSIKLFLDSQSALDACRLELNLVCPDFYNQCWVKCHHIVNVIHNKNLKIS
ncbi:hypothetical protein G9A89_023928 [Geosiphon pyriformis]|nr:hypothetical protein G9A89_023928 [Geosiphon pyriformis]